MEQNPHKVVLLGSPASGKTCILTRASRNTFTQQPASVGASICMITVVLKTDTIKLKVWDTAGQEKFSALSSMYARGATVALIVFDVSRKETFDRAKLWVEEISNQMPDPYPTRIILVGNKSDLADRKVKYEEASVYADEVKIKYIETSALLPQNINELLQMTAVESLSVVQVEKLKSSNGEKGYPSTPVICVSSSNEQKSKCC